jgi:hypothetical protein
MIAPAEEVIRGITLYFCLLKYCRCNENGAVKGRYRYHGQTRGVQALVVGCAFANLLSVEYEQYYIQKCLDITLKKPSSIPSCAPEITLHFAQTPNRKWDV